MSYVTSIFVSCSRMFKKLLTAAMAAGSLAFAGEHWNVDPGGVTMKFLALQVSPRTAAMAGAGVADPARASEVTRNPLAMSTVESPVQQTFQGQTCLLELVILLLDVVLRFLHE